MKQEFKNHLTTALLSCPIVYVPHFHYQFVDDTLQEIFATNSNRKLINLTLTDNLIEYDCGQNRVVRFKDKKLDIDMVDYRDVSTLLTDIITIHGINQPTILLLKNFASYLRDIQIQTLLATFASQYEKNNLDVLSTIIIVSPLSVTSIPIEIEKFVTVIDITSPTESEIMEIISRIPISAQCKTRENELRTDLCRTLQGLQMYEIEQILCSVLIRTGFKMSDKTKRLALEEKKNIVKKSGIIEVVDADVSLNEIGGLDILKEEIIRKGNIYKNISEAQTYKVPLPKGVLIIGMPGCGKSMIAKSIANEFGVSLLRLDINRLMGQYVGQSEANLRQALATAEAAHPCVLWIDEIEKAFAGSNGQNNDMLVMRLMGHFLTWMQERKTPVYIVATANDIMRPEFMRKGRFDEVYFVDFPTENERKQILEKKIAKYISDNNSIFDFTEIEKKYGDLSKKMIGNELMKDEFNHSEKKGFSGAEIESIVNVVIEKKFVEYIEKSKEPNFNKKAKIKLSVNDFDEVIKSIEGSVMANQVSRIDQETKTREKTNIERIYEMQIKYKFKRATKIR